MSGEWTPEDKIHVAFMGPPLLSMLAECFCGEITRFDPEDLKLEAGRIERDRVPLERKCECGGTIELGKDDAGWYLQGITSVMMGKNL